MATPVQTAKAQNANGTQATDAFAWLSPLTVGNRVIVVIALSGSSNVPSPTVSSVNVGTDALSLVTGAAISNSSGNSGIRCEIWAGTVATAGQTALTVNASGACNIEASAGEYAGGTYTLTLDGAAVTNTGLSGTPTTGNLTTTNANDLLIAGIAILKSSGGTSPTNSFVIEITEGALGSGSGKSATGAADADLLDRVVSATGTYSTGDSNTSANWATVIVAFQKVAAVATPLLPLPLRRGLAQRRRLPHVRPKRPVRSYIELYIPPAPFPNFPEQIRRAAQRRRLVIVRPLRPHRSELNRLLIPPRPFPELPAALRHRQQPHRIPRVHAKRPLRSNLLLGLPVQHPFFPPELRHRQQPHRLVRVVPLRPRRSHLNLPLIPPAPPAVAPRPLLVHNQRHRLVHVVALRPHRSNLSLIRIPPAPVVGGNLPLIFHGRQLKRLVRVHPKRHTYHPLFPQPLPTPFPPSLRRAAQRHFVPRIHPKRPLRANLELVLIPPAPVGIFPPELRHPAQRRRLVRIARKLALRERLLTQPAAAAPPPVAPPEEFIWRSRHRTRFDRTGF